MRKSAQPSQSDNPSQVHPSPTAEPQTSGAPGLRDPDSVARRAYERFQARGGEHGHDQEDWFSAERELSVDEDRLVLDRD